MFINVLPRQKTLTTTRDLINYLAGTQEAALWEIGNNARVFTSLSYTAEVKLVSR